MKRTLQTIIQSAVQKTLTIFAAKTTHEALQDAWNPTTAVYLTEEEMTRELDMEISLPTSYQPNLGGPVYVPAVFHTLKN